MARYNLAMKPAKVKPQSIYLSAEEIEQVRKISESLGISPHAVRAFAVKRLIADWAKGWRPKRKKKVISTLEP